MRPLDELVVEILGDLLSVGGQPGLMLAVTGLDVSLPVEVLIGANARLWLSPPRGVMRTGFEMPLGRVRMQYGGI